MASSRSGDNADETYLLELARFLSRVWQDGGIEGVAMFNNILMQNNIKNPPASKEFVANLKAVIKTDDKCSICLGNFLENELVKQLPNCGHCYHADCILPWLGQTNTCPTCRHEYPTDDFAYEEKRRLGLKEKDREERLEDLHNSMFS